MESLLNSARSSKANKTRRVQDPGKAWPPGVAPFFVLFALFLATNRPVWAENLDSEDAPTLMARIWAGTAPKTISDSSPTGYRVDGFFGAEIGHFIGPQWSAQAHVGFLWVTETQIDSKGVEVDHGSGRLDLSEYGVERSEEHTSELQSHSFISYAVFCLKK